jgi:hypothetical protein
VPELLRNGYVFLADAENQTGLTGAADKINALRTGLSEISPYTMVVNIAGQNQVQIVQNGQSTMFPVELRIPRNLDSDSTANWTRIPCQTGQSERSDAGLKVFTPSPVLGSSF